MVVIEAGVNCHGFVLALSQYLKTLWFMDKSDDIHHPDHYAALLDKLVERGWISAVARNATGEFVFEWTPKGRNLAWQIKVISAVCSKPSAKEATIP